MTRHLFCFFYLLTCLLLLGCNPPAEKNTEKKEVPKKAPKPPVVLEKITPDPRPFLEICLAPKPYQQNTLKRLWKTILTHTFGYASASAPRPFTGSPENCREINRKMKKKKSLYMDHSTGVIRDFSPLKEFTNLEQIRLDIYGEDDEHHPDLSPLSGLTRLKKIFIKTDHLNLSFLKPLTRLENLRFYITKSITHTEGLSGLSRLKEIIIMGEHVSFTFPSLKKLTRLEDIDFYKVTVDDITPLAAATALKYLKIYPSKIQDICPLQNLTQLRGVTMPINRIKTVCSLKRLKKLRYLELSGNQISDLTPFSGLDNLRRFEIGSNKIRDLSPLQQLKNLKNLSVEANQLEDLTPLKHLPKISFLTINKNKINDLSPLQNLKMLKSLYMNHNQVTSLAPLKNLQKLTKIMAHSNRITDISVLRHLPQLRRLTLRENPIKDYSPLQYLLEGRTYKNCLSTDLKGIGCVSEKSKFLQKLEKEGFYIPPVNPEAELPKNSGLTPKTP